MIRQMPYEPLPASVLFGFGCGWVLLTGESEEWFIRVGGMNCHLNVKRTTLRSVVSMIVLNTGLEGRQSTAAQCSLLSLLTGEREPVNVIAVATSLRESGRLKSS
jgi:hypothetical protein